MYIYELVCYNIRSITALILKMNLIEFMFPTELNEFDS